MPEVVGRGGGRASFRKAGAANSGVTSYANWDALPSSGTERDLAYTEDDTRFWEWRVVSGDSGWMPAEETRDGVVAYQSDTNAALTRMRLSDAAIPAHWVTVGASKSESSPLTLAAGSGSNYAATQMPSSPGGLYMLKIIPTALMPGDALVAYLAGGTDLLPGTYITPSGAVVGNLSGAQAGTGGDQVPAAGRPIFVIHDDRGANRLTRVIVPGYSGTRESVAPRSSLATNTPLYFGATNLSSNIVQIDYIGAFSITH